MSEFENNSFGNTFEKTFYTFDNVSLPSSGYVEIRNNTIFIYFPDISTVTEKPTSNYKSVQIFINDNLNFSFDWLPFYSLFDRFRVIDMFLKSYELFCNMIQGHYFSPFPHTNKSNHTYASIVTQIEIPNQYKLYCIEDWNTTSIQISLDKQTDLPPIEHEKAKTETETESYLDLSKPKNCSETPFQFQLSIGENCVFDTERDLKGLHQHHINCIVQFMLHKLIHMD